VTSLPMRQPRTIAAEEPQCGGVLEIDLRILDAVSKRLNEREIVYVLRL
jgi:hypothetical protein